MGLIQNLLSLLYEQRTQDFVVHWLKPDQVPDRLGRMPLPPYECYLRIDLRSLRVVGVQEGLTRLYGMVSSQISLSHLDQGEATFQTVVAPPQLKDVDARHLDRFLSFNQPLVGPVPFRGGDVRLQVGLFSVASANLLTPYVNLLEEITKLGSVEFISVALPYAGLLAKGIGLLTGTSNPKMLEIGVATSFDQVTSGWLLVMRADRTQYPPDRLDRLTVSAADSKLLDGVRPVADAPYMVLRVSGSPTREDWFKVPELRAEYDRFAKVLRKGEATEIKPALAAFERFLQFCPDILSVDSQKIASRARQDVDRLYPPARSASADLESISSSDVNAPEPLPLESYSIY